MIIENGSIVNDINGNITKINKYYKHLDLKDIHYLLAIDTIFEYFKTVDAELVGIPIKVKIDGNTEYIYVETENSIKEFLNNISYKYSQKTTDCQTLKMVKVSFFAYKTSNINENTYIYVNNQLDEDDILGFIDSIDSIDSIEYNIPFEIPLINLTEEILTQEILTKSIYKIRISRPKIKKSKEVNVSILLEMIDDNKIGLILYQTLNKKKNIIKLHPHFKNILDILEKDFLKKKPY